MKSETVRLGFTSGSCGMAATDEEEEEGVWRATDALCCSCSCRVVARIAFTWRMSLMLSMRRFGKFRFKNWSRGRFSPFGMDADSRAAAGEGEAAWEGLEEDKLVTLEAMAEASRLPTVAADMGTLAVFGCTFVGGGSGCLGNRGVIRADEGKAVVCTEVLTKPPEDGAIEGAVEDSGLLTRTPWLAEEGGTSWPVPVALRGWKVPTVCGRAPPTCWLIGGAIPLLPLLTRGLGEDVVRWLMFGMLK